MANWKDWIFGQDAFEEPVYSKEKNVVMDKLRRVATQQGDLATVREVMLRRNTRALKEFRQQFAQSPELVFKQWELAKRSVLPHDGELGAFEVLPTDPFRGIELTLQKTPSLYRDEVFARFAGNLRTIHRSGAIDVLGRVTEPQLVGYMQAVNPLLPQPSVLDTSKFDIQDRRLQSIVQSISDTLGFGLKVERRSFGSGAGELLFTEEGGKRVLFTLPEAFAARQGDSLGLVRAGSTLQNIYAPGLFAQVSESGELSDDLMTFTHFKANKVLQAVQSYKSGEFKGTLRAAINLAQEEADKFLDFAEPGIGEGDFSLETIYKSNQLTVFDSTGKPLRGVGQRDFLNRYANKLGLTPVSGQGKFGLMDPEEIYGGFFTDQDWARKPWQFIRQFRPTDEAMSAIRQSAFGSEDWDFLDSPAAIKQFNGPSGPRLKTLYLTDEQVRYLSEMFNIPIGDGELLVNSSIANQAQVTRRRRIGLSEINNHLAKEFMNRGIRLETLNSPKRFDPFEIEGIFGVNIEGMLQSVEQGQRMRVLGVAPSIGRGPDGSKIKTLDLLVEDIIDMGGLEKQFGSLKGMARRIDFSHMSKIVTPFGFSLSEYLGVPEDELASYGAIGRLDDLKKDRSKLLMQRYSQLMHYAQQRGATDIFSNAEANLRRLRGMSPAEQDAELINIAKQLNLTPDELSRVRLHADMGEGMVEGIARLNFGGTKEFTGAGNMGTMEPRILTLLEGGAFGSRTEQVGTELLRRVAGAHPDKFLLHQGLGKTLESIAGRIKPGPRDIVIDPTEMTTDDMARFRATGGWMRTGVAEIPYVYMPGYEQVPALRPMKIGSGDTVEPSQISKIFREIENDVRLLSEAAQGYNSDVVLANFDRDETGYISRLAREYVVAGKGTGALTRGNLLGSRFLTAASDIGDVPSDFYPSISKMNLPDPSLVVGVPEEHGLKMIKEMSDLYGAEAMDEMANRFMKGQLVGGAIARHPFIGPYSMQPVLMKKVKTSEPVLLVPEKTKSVVMHVGGQDISGRITTGVLTGLALDKDADTPIAMAFDPEQERFIREGLTNPNSELMRRMNTGLREIEDHNIRMQLLKAKKGQQDTTLSQLQKMIADKSKLSVIDEEVGRVSSALQNARAAIVNSSLDRGAQSQALGLLEWLEQQPISGKHLSQSRVLHGEFERQMSMIRRGASGDKNALIQTVNSMILGSGDPAKEAIAQAMLGEGMDITIDGERRFVRGFNLEQTASNISRALQEYKSVGFGKQQASIDRFISMKGRQSINRANLPKLLDANNLAAGADGFAGITRETIASINKVTAQASAKLRPMARPALIAMGALGAGAALFSGPPSTLPPPDIREELPPPKMNVSYSAPVIRNNSRDEIEPSFASQELGNPSGPRMAANSATVIEDDGAARRRSFRTEIRARGITPRQREELGRRLSKNYGGDVHLTLNDYRRSLNQKSLSDMLED